MNNIKVKQIINPIPATDGAGVKLKRSIGVEPNYFDPFLMNSVQKIVKIILRVFLLILIEELRQSLTC